MIVLLTCIALALAIDTAARLAPQWLGFDKLGISLGADGIRLWAVRSASAEQRPLFQPHAPWLPLSIR